MTNAQIETCLTSTGEAKYALSNVSGREQFVVVYSRSNDGRSLICKTMAGNDVYRTARQLKALTSEQLSKLAKLRGSDWLISA